MIGARVEESLPIPVSGRPKQPLVANGKFRGNGLYDLAVAASLEVAEIVATEQIECSTLSRDGQQVWIRSGLICQKQGTARPQVLIIGRQSHFVVWREIVDYSEASALQLQ